MREIFSVIFIFITITANFSKDENREYNIYLNADMSGAKYSGSSIEMGIRMALSEVDYLISGYNFNLIVQDHHGNTRRSLIYLEDFYNDNKGLVSYTGLHSPPVINSLPYINEKKIPILIPWAAAGLLTRSTDENGDNWVYRLSVDDTKAGEVITSYTIDNEGFRKPLLLLENTDWGRSNFENMSKALKGRGIVNPDTIWFSWGIQRKGSHEIINDILKLDNDVIFFVGNSPEGVILFKAISELDNNNKLPIRSHWGITGGDFFATLGPDLIMNKIDLKFIQTTFSFVDNDSSLGRVVFQRINDQYEFINEPEDLKAPNGFIHAYDLTKLFIEAFTNIIPTGDIIEDRLLLRNALENLNNPVEGLIKTYVAPFSKYEIEHNSAHEALNIEDFSMAKYLLDGSIEVINEEQN